MGGIGAAVERFQNQSTPNLLIVESTASREKLLSDLAALADVCQPDTKVVVFGQINDVILYRELIRQGVSEYLVAPSTLLHLIDVVSGLYRGEATQPLGRILAFVPARGGVGASTIAHNCAWHIARARSVETTLVDLDIAFGTALLNFNAEAGTGFLDALAQPDRIDALLLERLLIKLGPKLTLLATTGGIQHDIQCEVPAVESILSVLRTNVPFAVLDVPHVWLPWTRMVLRQADQIIIIAEPELSSLRNAKYLVDHLKAARPNDPPPRLVLNKVGQPRRMEILPADFTKALGVEVSQSIPSDPHTFVGALNNGKMLLEMFPTSKPAESLSALSSSLTGAERTVRKSAGNPFVSKLKFWRKP